MDICDEIMADLIEYERSRAQLPKFGDIVVGDIDTPELVDFLEKTLEGYKWAQPALLQAVARRRNEKNLQQQLNMKD